MHAESTRRRSLRRRPWVAGAVAGFVAGVGMGVVLSVGTTLLPLIGALYGVESFLGGWLAHLFNSVVFGVLFGELVSRRFVREGTTRVEYVALGVAYGAALGILTGGVLLPIWLRAGGVRTLSVPFLPIPGFVSEFGAALVLGVAHLVYGVLLGAVYAVVRGADRRSSHR